MDENRYGVVPVKDEPIIDGVVGYYRIESTYPGGRPVNMMTFCIEK